MEADAEAGHGSNVDANGFWGTPSKRLKSGWRIPLWALLLGITALFGSVSGAFIWWYWGGSDFAARRWKVRDPVIASDEYKWAVRQHPIDEKGPIKEHPDGMTSDWTRPHVAVFSVPALHIHPTLRDLADRGQARAIDFLEHDPGAKPSAWAEVEEALSDWGAKPGENDPFKFDRTIVATVTKGVNWDPGDRMVWTRLFVQPINFFFAGYTIAATENATVKVASVEATKTRKLSTDLGLTLPGLGEDGPKVSAGPSNERSIKTTSDINVQYEKLGIDILPYFLRIIRESETGGDVVGNTTVALSIVTDALTIHKNDPDPLVPSPHDKDKLVSCIGNI